VAFLSEGRIVALDTPGNLKTAHGQNQVNVTLDNGECVSIALGGADAGRELQQLVSNGQVRTLHSAEATLEEVFIQLAGRRLNESQHSVRNNSKRRSGCDQTSLSSYGVGYAVVCRAPVSRVVTGS